MLKIAWSPVYAHPLPDNHRFPMEKYNLLPEQLIYEGTINQENLFAPEPLDEQSILEIHTSEWWQKLKTGTISDKEARQTGFPYSPELVSREIVIMNGTVKAAYFAQQYGTAFNVAGGTHHAFTNRGEGFCLLNDIALGASALLNENANRRILVIDLDVHQGNGTAEIFSTDERVFTFSMHGKNNYPLRKEKSDCDVELLDGTDDKTYLKLLDHHLNKVVDDFKPDFAFYQCGVDVLATDQLGKLGMSIEGCKARDRFVLELCKRNSIPVAASMGGGYSKNIQHIIEAHANTFRLAQEIYF